MVLRYTSLAQKSWQQRRLRQQQLQFLVWEVLFAFLHPILVLVFLLQEGKCSLVFSSQQKGASTVNIYPWRSIMLWSHERYCLVKLNWPISASLKPTNSLSLPTTSPVLYSATVHFQRRWDFEPLRHFAIKAVSSIELSHSAIKVF